MPPRTSGASQYGPAQGFRAQARERVRLTERRRETLDSFDLFMSYSHAADRELAPVLQRLICRVGLPWYRRSTVRVFRDQTNLPMAASLWGVIEEALNRSRNFVLMASPGAAASPWVAREVEYWRKNRDSKTFWIVLTSGEIAWDADTGDFDWNNSNAIPRALSGWFRDEPSWIDVRLPVGVVTHRDQRNEVLRDAARTLAAPLYGVEKDQLDGEDERESRRARRTLRGGVAALVVLTVVALVAAFLAVTQLRNAQNQARIALARQLAALSSTQLTSRLDLANLLAVQAFRTDPNPQTRSALFQATTVEGKLVRYLPFGAYVSTLSASGNGEAIVAGLKDGRVLRRWLAERAPEPLYQLGTGVISVATSADGMVVVATDGTTAMLARPARQPVSLPVVVGQLPRAVAVSPSGNTVVVVAAEDRFQGRASVTVLDTRRVAVRRLERDPFPDLAAVPSRIVASDEEVFLLDSGYGSWTRRRFADWSSTASSSASFGVHNLGVAVSADGVSFTYTNGGSTIPVWRADGPTDPDRPGRTAEAPIANPNSLALSADGTRLAVADSGAVFVTQVADSGAPRVAPVRLLGNNSTNPDGLQFLGASGQRLVAATGDQVAVWDLSQTARTARSFDIPVGYGCGACGGPAVSLSPDGTQLAVIGGFGDGVVVPIDAPELHQALPDEILGSPNVPPVWDVDGRHVIHGLPAGERAGGIAAAGTTDDRKHVVVVEIDGGIDLVDTETGATQQITPDPEQPPGPTAPQVKAAAVGRDAELVAVVSNTSVLVQEARTGRTVGTVPGSDVTGIAFTDDWLLIQRQEGALEIWDQHATRLDHVIAGDPSFVWPPVANAQGTIVARQRSDSSVVLADIATGTTLTTIPPDGSEPGLRAGLAFSPDGRRLVTVVEGSDPSSGRAVVREVSDHALVRIACATAGRNLTVQEWQTVVGSANPGNLSCAHD